MDKIKQTISIKKIVFCGVFFCLITESNAQEITSLYKQVNESVVTIITESKLLDERHQMITDKSIGSGVLISKSGEILTAAHVVNNAEKIIVKFLSDI